MGVFSPCEPAEHDWDTSGRCRYCNMPRPVPMCAPDGHIWSLTGSCVNCGDLAPNAPLRLAVAENPVRQDLLDALDRVRAEVLLGKTLALILIPVHVGREFSTRSVGDISMLETAGMLARAHLDALESLTPGRRG